MSGVYPRVMPLCKCCCCGSLLSLCPDHILSLLGVSGPWDMSDRLQEPEGHRRCLHAMFSRPWVRAIVWQG